eukprot:COSAG04_NODE_6065_length_1419_cov_1.355303_3_plen_157_part_01
MVVSVGWAAEHLHEGDDIDLQRLYVTNGEHEAPPALRRWPASTPLPELLAAFERDGVVVVSGVYTADEVSAFREDHDRRLDELVTYIGAHPRSYTRHRFIDPHYDRSHPPVPADCCPHGADQRWAGWSTGKPEWVVPSDGALPTEAAGRVEKVAAGL